MRSKNSYYKLIAVCAIVLVVVNIIVFAVPFRKTAVFWVSDIFVVISLLVLVLTDLVAYRNAETIKSKFYGYPVLKVGFIYVLVTMIFAIIFIILSCRDSRFETWIPVVVFVILTGAAGIGLITTSSTRDFVEKSDEELKAKTDFMRKFRTEILALVGQTEKDNLIHELQDLAEKIRYSDSVSSDATAEAEGMLAAEVTLLKEAVRNDEESRAIDLCKKLTKDLNYRNAICKANKGN